MAFFDSYGGYNMNSAILSEVPVAANISCGGNPDYTVDMFNSDFPQFGSYIDDNVISAPLINQFTKIANATISISKYGELWQRSTGLYVAHLLTLFLTASQNSATVPGLTTAAKPLFPVSSMGALGTTVSFDTSSIMDDLKGFGMLKTTMYGQELATYAKMAGMGGMFVC